MYTHTYLPSNVKLCYVGAVLGKLLGCKVKMEYTVSDLVNPHRCSVQGVFFKHSKYLTIINIRPKRGYHYQFFYDYEPDHYEWMTLVSQISYPFYLAIGKRLCDFFGGMLFYRDERVGQFDADYAVVSEDNKYNRPQSMDGIRHLNARIFALKPITRDEIKQYSKYATYRSTSPKLVTE